jgi:hypothetical protein
MIDERPPVKRRRLGAHGMMFRRRRVFARLREGFTYDEIAAEEGVSSARVRQVVTEELQKRAVDSGADHAKLQLDRLAPAVQLGAEAIAAGDVSAIAPYLKALDRLDRYQSVAVATQTYDDEARKKLMQKINRMADNLGVDEMWNAAREYLKKHGAFPAHPDELRVGGEAEDLGLGEEVAEVGVAEAEDQPEGQGEASQWMAI